MVSEWIESIKPVAWSGTRQVTLVPSGESPLAQLNMPVVVGWVRFPPLATSEVYTHKFCTKCYSF